jgi:hypothetical protein
MPLGALLIARGVHQAGQAVMRADDSGLACQAIPRSGFRRVSQAPPKRKPKTFSVHALVGEAIGDEVTRAEAVNRVKDNLRNRKSVPLGPRARRSADREPDPPQGHLGWNGGRGV